MIVFGERARGVCHVSQGGPEFRDAPPLPVAVDVRHEQRGRRRNKCSRRPNTHGVVVDTVNVSVFVYAPVRRASPAPMCWRNVIATAAFETGPVHDAGAMSTRSASGRE